MHFHVYPWFSGGVHYDYCLIIKIIYFIFKDEYFVIFLPRHCHHPELSLAVPVANSLTFLCTLLTGKLLGEEFGGKRKWTVFNNKITTKILQPFWSITKLLEHVQKFQFSKFTLYSRSPIRLFLFYYKN